MCTINLVWRPLIVVVLPCCQSCVVIVLDPAKILSLLLDIWLLMLPLIMSVVYVWCQLNKDTVIPFWFGIQFKVNECYVTWAGLVACTKSLSMYFASCIVPLNLSKHAC